MPVITQPEILRTDLASTVLYLKALRLESLDVASFDFLDTPGAEAIGEALRQLYVLGAIDADGEATPVGREMSPMPVEPRLARDVGGAETRVRRGNGRRRRDAQRRARVRRTRGCRQRCRQRCRNGCRQE